MDDKIFCPLVDEKIEPVDCMENRETREESIPQKYNYSKEASEFYDTIEKYKD